MFKVIGESLNKFLCSSSYLYMSNILKKIILHIYVKYIKENNLSPAARPWAMGLAPSPATLWQGGGA